MVFAALAWAGPQARVGGVVLDSAGNPIPTATINVTSPDQESFEKSTEVNEKGSFKMLILDATRRYVFHVSAPGYVGHDQEFKVGIGTTDQENHYEFVLPTQQEIAMTEQQNVLESPGYKELEAGRQALEAGDRAGAKALFEQAVEAVPDLVAAWEHLATVCLEDGDNEAALAAATSCLEEDDESINCLAIAANASRELGDLEAQAGYMARYQDLNPDDPTTLFNQAAQLLNAMDDEQARPLLEQCLDVDPEFPQCLFEYGMLLLRTGDIEGAKANLQKYIEVAPDGVDAATAVETVKYL